MKFKVLCSLLVISIAFSGCSRPTSTTNNSAIVETTTENTTSQGNPSPDFHVYIGDGADGYKLHLKNEKNNEDKILVNTPIRDACKADGWIYYLQMGDDEGIFRLKFDGSDKSKICTLDAMTELKPNTNIVSKYEDGHIFYQLDQMKEQGDDSSNKTRFYILDLKSGKVSLKE